MWVCGGGEIIPSSILTCTIHIMGGCIPQILYGPPHLNSTAVDMSVGDVEAEQPPGRGGEGL